MLPDWNPRFTITSEIAQSLMQIEAARAVVAHTPLSVSAEAELRHRARIRSTHYSTQIEGNRLTLAEAEQVIDGRPIVVQGRECDVREVKNYWNAFLRIEEWARARKPFTENLICKLHALVEHGARAKPSAYRDGQNVIRNAATGRIVYLPPAAEEVPALIGEMVRWAETAMRENLPAPLVAGLVHYQFVTIHPYYDGNGRTARLLATFLLHGGGYGLNGFFSLEEYHARDLDAYYHALVTHPHHNYYEGRAEADLSGWLTYFLGVLSLVFSLAQEEALRIAQEGSPLEPETLRRLDARARAALALFTRQETITAVEIARTLGIAERTARELLAEWVREGWLQIVDASNRGRSYSLSAAHRRFIGGPLKSIRQYHLYQPDQGLKTRPIAGHFQPLAYGDRLFTLSNKEVGPTQGLVFAGDDNAAQEALPLRSNSVSRRRVVS